MSSSRNNTIPGRTHKPALVSTKSLDRHPFTPRLAASSTIKTTTPRLRQPQDVVDSDGALSSDNVTPRSAKRRSRVESSNNTPTQDSPGMLRASTVSPLSLVGSTPSINGLTLGRPITTRSPMSDTAITRAQAPFVRSPIGSEVHAAGSDNGLDSRFFHASDITKVEAEVKKPETRKAASFFYADGQQEQRRSGASTRTTSPARSEKRFSGMLPRHAAEAQVLTKSPSLMSPALSTVSASPFFTPAGNLSGPKPRSPSPTKENIHLSYRKGASQIFGQRPSPIPSARTQQELAERRPSFQRAFQAHKKSPSLSSIDSELTNSTRRRSNTAQDFQGSSPLKEESSSVEPPHSPTPTIPMISTTIEPSIESGTLSPTKAISELAADARRERKVLDLEISNSSLLAINSSLEREIRRQKGELKRFRRLSRAGRFSFDPLETRRGSGSLLTVEEDADDMDADLAQFGPASGLSELYDDISSSDDESSVTSGDPLHGDVKVDRLAKDDRRLRADLEKHRDLLVQSQMMNQSIRRCMYATEEMIKEGKKAIDYKVRVSDVKLGGRILTGHEDEDEDGNIVEQIEIEDEFDNLSLASPMSQDGVDDHAQNFMELWGGIGKINTLKEAGRSSIEEGETGDRDSGIEIERLVQRPPEESSTTDAREC